MKVITTATSTEVGERGAAIAVLPVGSFEQHGSHLPLSTDTLVASAIANAISEAHGLFLLPPITLSCSHEHAAWSGTVSISATTVSAVISDVAASLKRSGIGKLVIVNGHGGNYFLSNVTQEANVNGPVMTLFPGRSDWESARTYAGMESNFHDDMHAGEMEASLLLHAFPEVVRSGYESTDTKSGPRPFLLIHGLKAYTHSGVIGTPSLATAEKGKRLLEQLAESFKDHLHELMAPGHP